MANLIRVPSFDLAGYDTIATDDALDWTSQLYSNMHRSAIVLYIKTERVERSAEERIGVQSGKAN